MGQLDYFFQLAGSLRHSWIVKSVETDKGVLQFENGTGILVIRIKDIDGECFLTE